MYIHFTLETTGLLTPLLEFVLTGFRPNSIYNLVHHVPLCVCNCVCMQLRMLLLTDCYKKNTFKAMRLGAYKHTSVYI